MKLRAPAYPLINVDPYFNLWMMGDCPTADDTRHWTGSVCPLRGTAVIDGTLYRFLGIGDGCAMKHLDTRVDALTTAFTFEAAGVKLTAAFTTAHLLKDMTLFSRPLTTLAVTAEATDGQSHDLRVRIAGSEAFVLDKPGDSPVLWETVGMGDIGCVRLGSAEQKKLTRSGDDLRIEWGYLYLAALGAEVGAFAAEGQRWAFAERKISLGETGVFGLGYDDIDALIYFREPVKAWWKKDGAVITDVIREAILGYADVQARCDGFAAALYADCEAAGGWQYAELCTLAYRQSIGAHKLAADREGKLLFISKECFSNGCAATVDVSYPSIPQYLVYAPELVFGMMRPILRYAAAPEWGYDFAPHDCGQYPLINGNVYGENKLEMQMPVEECGNLLVMAAAASKAVGDLDFCRPHMARFAQWVKYLEQYGADPANQLCTDDFAGHLAHNCNLSLKAIMGIACYGLLLEMDGQDGSHYLAEAKTMAASWLERAANGDGTYRLAFDLPGSYSLKYNAVWDRWLGTGIFPAGVFEQEVDSYLAKQNRFGMVLDNRAGYTKADWLIWAARLSADNGKFMQMVSPLWDYYNETDERVPMTDWYETESYVHHYFQNRTVIGGLFMGLLVNQNPSIVHK